MNYPKLWAKYKWPISRFAWLLLTNVTVSDTNGYEWIIAVVVDSDSAPELPTYDLSLV